MGEEALRQQPHVLGEEAEHALHEEVGGVVGIVPPALPLIAPPLVQALGELAELFGDLLGDLFGRDRGAKRIGIGEDAAEDHHGLALQRVALLDEAVVGSSAVREPIAPQ